MAYTYTNGKINVARQTAAQVNYTGGLAGKIFTAIKPADVLISTGNLCVFNGAPDAGTIRNGVGTKWGMMCTIVGPAPSGAIKKRGRAVDGQGRQYLVNNAVPTHYIDRLPFNDNGDLCTSGYA